MDSPDIQRVRHIREYCERIAKTVERYGCDYDIFVSDGDYFDSVSMKVMQIGELAGGLSDEFREKTSKQMQWGAIRGMRNLFAHAYASMDKKVIWDVAVQDIPGLLIFCDETIKRELTTEKPSVLEKIRADKQVHRNNPASERKRAKNNNEPEL